MTKSFIILWVLSFTFFTSCKGDSLTIRSSSKEVGQAIDSLNTVMVYYNGTVGNVIGRNTKNGYNLGLKYQCIEFVKRYYYEYYNHEMPDSYGHAKSFFNPNVKDGKKNKQRNLIQYTNPSSSKPKIGDLIVMNATTFNPYGHVAIISNVFDNRIEIIQQNPGPTTLSRIEINLFQNNLGEWEIKNHRVLGWLRKK